MATELTAEKLAQRALDVNIVSESDFRSVWSELGTHNVEFEQLQQVLLRRGLLTNYQIERLVQGYRTGFFYGDYKVQYSVGAGSFARVFRTTHRTTGEQYAVKVLRSRFSNPAADPKNPKTIRSFQREGKLGASLKHPNIVAIHEVESKGNVHYIVMDFVEGHNLRDFARIRGKFEPLEAARIVAGVVAGLTYAFQQGVTHRDLKLSNVLVSSEGEAQLVDFGLAGLGGPGAEESAADSTNPRTIDYAGLERATNVRKDDTRSDIFFVGCIFYQLLCGQPAMEVSRDKTKRYSKTRYQDIKPIGQIAPELPLALVRVLNKSLEFDPERRYQTPGEFLADLKLTAKRLEEHGEGRVHTPVDSGSLEGHDDAGDPRKLMVVESDTKMQDLFRTLFKKRGYRVLVTSDPERLFLRFYENNKTADIVLVSTGHIGPKAVEVFNRLGEEPATKQLPAILLLGDEHGSLRDKVQSSARRVVLQMPVKSRQLRKTVLEVLKSPAPA